MAPDPNAGLQGVAGGLIRSAERRPFVAGLGVLALVSLLFLGIPRIDLTISGLFYDPATGFLHERFEVVQTIREAGRLVEMLFAAAVIAPLAIKLLLPARPLLLRPRAILFVFASYLVGVGLIVNIILKEHWGRARPREVLEFGGEAAFSPVWWISDQCESNCSFVSGEGAASFWLVALAFIVSQRWRAVTAIATLAFAALVSFTRIAMGGHFLSDVLIAWLVMLLVMILLGRALLQGLTPGFDAGVERRLGQAGRILRRPFALRRPPPPL